MSGSSWARILHLIRKGRKRARGCAGVFSAHAALNFYAMAFDSVGKLDKLEAFASHNGADFYRVRRNSGTITLKREEWKVPKRTSSAETWWCRFLPARRFRGLFVRSFFFILFNVIVV